MKYPRQLLLEDGSIEHGVWNERMLPGEYAVHYSTFVSEGYSGPYCSVFGDLDDAVAHARLQVEERPKLCCTIYDHHGFGKVPVREIRGIEYKDSSDLSPRFRRWAGPILFFGGAILIVIDWRSGFELSWPAMIGVRIIIPGFGLLFIEGFLVMSARRKRKQGGAER